MSLSFNQPSLLALLALPVVFLVMYVVLQLRRRRYAVRFTNLALLDRVAPRRPPWRRHLAAALFLLGVVGLVGAAAQPFLPLRHGVSTTAIMLAIDISGSMNADDVTPTRIDAAKHAADTFVDGVPSDINVGLVAFSSAANLTVAPTTNRDDMHSGIDSLSAYGGTAIGEAIFVSLDAIARLPKNPDGSPARGRVVLMSDGSTNSGRPNDSAAQAAAAAGVQVWTIAFGTVGAQLTLPGMLGPVDVSVDRAALGAISSQTGGQAFTAETAQQIKGVYADIGRSFGFRTDRQDVTAGFVVAALVLFSLAGAASLVWANRLP